MNKKLEILRKYLLEEDGELYEGEEIEIINGNLLEVIGEEYLVLTEEEAEEKAREEILGSLCYFRSGFILEHSIFWDSIPYGAETKEYEEIIKSIQEKENSELIKVIIKDIDYFIEEAIRWDGRGHFINTYDGEEGEIYYNDELYYIYRIE